MPSKNNNNTSESLKSISENSSSGRSNCSINVDMHLYEESPVQKISLQMSVGTKPKDDMKSPRASLLLRYQSRTKIWTRARTLRSATTAKRSTASGFLGFSL
jgi:hypothetical protein